MGRSASEHNGVLGQGEMDGMRGKDGYGFIDGVVTIALLSNGAFGRKAKDCHLLDTPEI